MNHPKECIEKAKRRYEMMLSNGYTLTFDEWQKNLEYFDYSCAYCGSRENLTKDHIIPVTKGGATSKQNVIPACLSCNSARSNREFTAWFKKQSFFTEEKLKRIMDVIRWE